MNLNLEEKKSIRAYGDVPDLAVIIYRARTSGAAVDMPPESIRFFEWASVPAIQIPGTVSWFDLVIYKSNQVPENKRLSSPPSAVTYLIHHACV